MTIKIPTTTTPTPTLTQDPPSVDRARQAPRPFSPQSVPNYGGDHHADLHRYNSQGSQRATERKPVRAPDPDPAND
jgi:hypothetical protein